MFAIAQLNHHTQVQSGVLKEECAELLKGFFSRQRALQQLEKSRAGRALRQDALRTPDSRFAGLPDTPVPSCYVNDLPSLGGLRLHYVDAGLPLAPEVILCLHGPGDWSYAWRHLVVQAVAQRQRVICPDLIGFGKSDKPKRAAIHTLAWHTQILLEWLDRLDVHNVTLIVSDAMSELAQLVLAGAHGRILNMVTAKPDGMTQEALEAPFPDVGHRAALRAFSSTTIPPL